MTSLFFCPVPFISVQHHQRFQHGEERLFVKKLKRSPRPTHVEFCSGIYKAREPEPISSRAKTFTLLS